jgi:glucose/arabinose dehydrogenase
MPGSSLRSRSFRRTVLLAVLLALLCAACDRNSEGGADDGKGLGPITTGASGASVRRVEVSTLATNLKVPWSFAFLPDGDALVTERDSGKLLRVSPSGDVREIQTLPEGGSGEGGLLKRVWDGEAPAGPLFC